VQRSVTRFPACWRYLALTTDEPVIHWTRKRDGWIE